VLIYVSADRLEAFNRDEFVKCYVDAGHKLKVTLLSSRIKWLQSSLRDLSANASSSPIFFYYYTTTIYMNETRKALRAIDESGLPIESLRSAEWSHVVSHLEKKDALKLFSANRKVRESAPQFPSLCFQEAKIQAIRKNMGRDKAFRCVRSAMYNTETLQRILLCNVSLSPEYAKPLRLYVHLEDFNALIEESTLICFAKEGFPIELVLLYKGGQLKPNDKYDDTLRQKGLPAFMDKALLLNGDNLPEKSEMPESPRVALEVSNNPKIDLGVRTKDFIHYVVPPHLPFLNEITSCMFSLSHIQSLPEMPNVHTINSLAFWGCVHLTTLPHMPELMCICTHAFERSGLMTLQDMPKLVQIQAAAFRDCKGLKSIALKSIQIIEEYAFSGNDDLETLQLPSCINYIGNDAFADCPKLRNVVVNDVESVKLVICECSTLGPLLLGNGFVRITPYVYAHADAPYLKLNLDHTERTWRIADRFARIAEGQVIVAEDQVIDAEDQVIDAEDPFADSDSEDPFADSDSEFY